MKKFSIYLFLFVGILGFSSCKKYDEGPAFSLRSKKARVVNIWKIEKFIINGKDETSNIAPLLANYTLTFKDDDTWESTIDGQREAGTWEFDSDKENLQIKTGNSSTIESAKILRLTNDELWTEQIEGSDKLEIHYETK
jgi:hypothetical protein